MTCRLKLRLNNTSSRSQGLISTKNYIWWYSGIHDENGQIIKCLYEYQTMFADHLILILSTSSSSPPIRWWTPRSAWRSSTSSTRRPARWSRPGTSRQSSWSRASTGTWPRSAKWAPSDSKPVQCFLPLPLSISVSLYLCLLFFCSVFLSFFLCFSKCLLLMDLISAGSGLDNRRD